MNINRKFLWHGEKLSQRINRKEIFVWQFGITSVESATNGWIDYSDNTILVELFSHAMLATKAGHEMALMKLKKDIEELKNGSNLGGR